MAKGGGGGGGQQQGDSSMDMLWITAFFMIGIGLAWYYGRAQIVPVIFAIRGAEIHLIAWFIEATDDVAAFLYLPQPSTGDLFDWLNFINSSDPKTVQFSSVAAMSQDVGSYFIYPNIIICGILGAYLFLNHIAARFRRTYDMKLLRSLEAHVWPFIMPVLRTNLIKTALDDGPWAMSEQPMGFAKKHLLLEKTTKDGKPAVKLIKGAAQKTFALQMGPIWQGRLDVLPIHVQALFAIFAARSEQDSKAAQNLMKQIATSSATGKLNFLGTRELLSKHVRAQSVGRVVSPHGFVLTVMASMLELARTDGVLASAEFLWLKPVDRQLWYMLSSVGRQTPFVEAAGPYAHWIVEKRLRRPLKVPMVTEAVNALEKALDDILYDPEAD